MAVQKSGVEAVIVGLANFLSGIGKMNAAYAGQIQYVDKWQKAVERAGNAQKSASNASANAKLSEANAIRRLQDVTAKASSTANQLAIAQNNVTKAHNNTTEANRKHQQAILAYTRAAQDAALNTQQMQNATQKLGISIQTATQLGAALHMTVKGLTTTLTVLAGIVTVVGTAFNILVGALKIGWNLFTWLANTVKNMVVGAFNLLKSAVEGLWNVFVKLTQPVRDFVSAVAKIVTSFLFIDWIRDVTSSIGQMRDEIISAISYLQLLNIQFETLQARDISKLSKGVLSVADAMDQASIAAKGLMQWVIQIAVTTPVTVEDIAYTLALANAYGVSTNMAKDLTSATVNFISAMGLTSDHMKRIIYNFGQMMTQGKLTGREFRDLAVSFVPVYDIIHEMAVEAGETDEAMKKMALSGGVAVEKFFQKFIEMVGRDFPNAAERMAKTWSAVVNNLSDFVHVVLGLNLLGPVWNKFTALASDALQGILKPAADLADQLQRNLDLITKLFTAYDNVPANTMAETMERQAKMAELAGMQLSVLNQYIDKYVNTIQFKSKLIGSALLTAFNAVYDAIETKLVPALSKLGASLGLTGITAQKVGTYIIAFGLLVAEGIGKAAEWITSFSGTAQKTFIELGKNMLKWGAMMMKALADGIIMGARFVVAALNIIAQIIASLLSAHSPPKILPHIEDWGMATMQAWLHGFMLADFDALSGLQGILDSVLDLRVAAQDLGEAMAADIYASISKAMAQALATGVWSEDLMREITLAGGPFGKQLADLAKMQFDLAMATKAVQKAEEDLAKAREKEAETRGNLSEKIRAYNEALRQGADKATLDAMLAQINATEDQAQADTAARVEAENTVDVQQQLVDSLEDMVSLQEQLVQQLVDISERQLPDLADNLGGSLGDFSDLGEDIGAAIGGGLNEELRLQLEAEAAVLKKQLDQMIADAKILVGQLMMVLSGMMINPLMEEEGTGGVNPNVPPLIRSPLGEFFDEIEQAAIDVGIAFDNIGISLGNIKWDTIGTQAQALADAIISMMEALTAPGAPQNHMEEELGAKSPLQSFIDSIKDMVTNINWGELVVGVQGFFNAFASVTPETWSSLAKSITDIANALIGFTTWIGGNNDWDWGMLTSGISTIATTDIAAKGDEIGTSFYDAITAKLDETNVYIGGTWNEQMLAAFQLLYPSILGHSPIPELMDGIWDKVAGVDAHALPQLTVEVGKKLGELIIKFSDACKAILGMFTGNSMSIVGGQFTPARTGLMGDVWNMMVGTDQYALPQLIAMADILLNGKDGLVTKWVNSANGIDKGLEPANAELQTLYDKLLNLQTLLLGEKWDLAMIALAALIGESPSPLAIGTEYAAEAMRHLQASLTSMANSVNTNAGVNYSAQTTTAMPVSMPASMTNSVSFGDTYVNDNMDFALMRQMIMSTIMEAMA